MLSFAWGGDELRFDLEPEGDERTRLWARWREIDPKLDAFAALRPGETAVVIFELRG